MLIAVEHGVEAIAHEAGAYVQVFGVEGFRIGRLFSGFAQVVVFQPPEFDIFDAVGAKEFVCARVHLRHFFPLDEPRALFGECRTAGHHSEIEVPVVAQYAHVAAAKAGPRFIFQFSLVEHHRLVGESAVGAQATPCPWYILAQQHDAETVVELDEIVVPHRRLVWLRPFPCRRWAPADEVVQVLVHALHFHRVDECRDDFGQELLVRGYLPLKHPARQVAGYIARECREYGSFPGTAPPFEIEVFHLRECLADQSGHHLGRIVSDVLVFGIYLAHQRLPVAAVAGVQAFNLRPYQFRRRRVFLHNLRIRRFSIGISARTLSIGRASRRPARSG